MYLVFPYDISLVLRRRHLYGKNNFFLFNLSLFIITHWNCRSIGSCCSGRGLQWQPMKLWWTPCPRGLRQCWKIIVATQNIDTLGPIWTFSLRGVLTFVASGLDQCFPNLSWRSPCPASFVCLPYLTHLIPLINSLVETARTKLGVSVFRETYKMCRPGGPLGQVWEALV